MVWLGPLTNPISDMDNETLANLPPYMIRKHYSEIVKRYYSDREFRELVLHKKAKEAKPIETIEESKAIENPPIENWDTKQKWWIRFLKWIMN